MGVLDKLGLGPTRTCWNEDGRWTILVRVPEWVGKYPPKSVTLTDDQFARYNLWLTGDGLIQRWLPDLTDNEREIILNGDPPLP